MTTSQKFMLDLITEIRLILEAKNETELLKESLWFIETNKNYKEYLEFYDGQVGSYKNEDIKREILSENNATVQHLLEYLLENIEEEFEAMD